MELTLKFKDDQFSTAVQKVNTILMQLSEGKFKDTFQLIQSIQEQVNPQIQKSSQMPEDEEVEEVQLPKK
jgi:hypothetical protein